MKLSYKDQNDLLKCFPKFELSYKKKTHKKVHSDICITIPKGKKFFAWFKTFKKQNICFLLELDRKYNSIEEITVNICSFDKILCSGKGTVLYGTIFVVVSNQKSNTCTQPCSFSDKFSMDTILCVHHSVLNMSVQQVKIEQRSPIAAATVRRRHHRVTLEVSSWQVIVPSVCAKRRVLILI